MAHGKSNRNSTALILSLAFLLVMAGTWACSGAGDEASEEVAAVEEGKLSFEGKVKLVVGKYLYVPEIQGFDVVIQGTLSSGDLASLVGQEVKIEGKYELDRTSVLIVDTLSTKDGTGAYSTVFTRTEEAVLEDYIDMQSRDGFVILEKLGYRDNQVWGEVEKAKVYGRLEGEEGSYSFVALDEEGKEVGKVIVDSATDFAKYYLQKLEHFDKFWFYCNIKETVPWNTRRQTREMFHADLVFAGLF